MPTMFKLFVCVSVLIAVVGADYDFQDPDFNQLIFDDLTADLMEPLRIKRGAHKEHEPKECHHMKDKKEKDSHCCSGDKPDRKEMDAVKEIKKNCIAEARGDSEADEASYDPLNCDSVQAMREQVVCAAECMAKKLDLLADGGDLKRDALLAQTRKVVGENRRKPGDLEKYVDKCLGELKPSMEMKMNDDMKNATCNVKPLEFHHCIWKEFIQGCPTESQMDNKKCRKIRERLSRGDTSHADKAFKNRMRGRH